MSIKYPDKKIIAVLPAYNAEKTLKRTVFDIPEDWIDEMILVDDASKDNTVAIAKSLKLTVFVHNKNIGYGGNQKTCYREALKSGADIIVMVHPDHQYDPRLVPDLLLPLLRGDSHAVFGSRMMESGMALKGGMPWWKYVANIILTKIANLILKLRLTEYHSGFRAYSKAALNSIDYVKNSNSFVFDTQIIIQLKLAGMKIIEVPITTRYFPEASTIGFTKSLSYGISILTNLLKYLAFKIGFIKHYNNQ